MKYKIVKDQKLSGVAASIYLIKDIKNNSILLDEFVDENSDDFELEVLDVFQRLSAIGNYEGTRRRYFKDKEGIPGDGVCALFDIPNKNLRLYCIKYGNQIIIVGSGGPKPKNIKAFQEDEKLKDENYFLRWLSQQISERIKKGEITFTNDGFDFDGNLEFDLELT